MLYVLNILSVCLVFNYQPNPSRGAAASDSLGCTRPLNVFFLVVFFFSNDVQSDRRGR